MHKITWASTGSPFATTVLLEDGADIGFGPDTDSNGNTITLWEENEEPELTEADADDILLAFRGEGDSCRVGDLGRLADWLEDQSVPSKVARSVFRDAADEASRARWTD